MRKKSNGKAQVEEIFRNVFVLTIERNKDRREYMKEALRGIDFSFHYGLDLTKEYLEYPYVAYMPEEVFAEYDMDRDHCRIWTKGQFGAFASEKKLIQDFARQGKNENLVILLDDLVLENSWRKTLVAAYKELPPDWDALILSTRLGKAKKRAFRFIIEWKRKWDPFFKNTKKLLVKKYSHHLDCCHSEISGIFGIIYSPKGLQKLINEPDQLRKDQDDILIGKLVGQSYLNVYLTYPLLGKEGAYDGSWTQKNEFEKPSQPKNRDDVLAQLPKPK
ncbi:glycosyltransferase family 25 protein [Flavisolibacter nicotianae]|uniref:glycosyltransferase family 25 protein n=1 Tax=Flavisolibacter nicotianae TaxID=2364882 RepID=UPI000EB19498|nr:glycosyltransferase family 25 protein [Flavisolibacter nicotianae]